VQTGELDPQGVFVLRSPPGIVGALVCLAVPGASALIWPPSCIEDKYRLDREDLLLRHTRGYLHQRGVKIAQALLAPAETSLGASLERNGFTHITHLWYLQHDLDISIEWLAWPARLEFPTYDECDHDLFNQTLSRTYEGTHDCPEVNGVRSIEEVIVGHRSQGVFDPERWHLATFEGQPVGVLMLMEMPETGDWDLSYMGVVREARRQGFAREILLRALFDARAADIATVTLSVDVRNRPAWQLYRSVGFEPFDRREVYLAIFRD
jgi:ribosomal protein S18 acetylase RimI-like enzyme